MTPADCRLVVRLDASQSRKRLQGPGFGAQRSETTGQHHAVIIHTAMGRRIDNFGALPSDVIEAERPDSSSCPWTAGCAPVRGVVEPDAAVRD